MSGEQRCDGTEFPDMDLLKQILDGISDPYALDISSYLESCQSVSNRLNDSIVRKSVGDAMSKVYLRKTALFCIDVEGGTTTEVKEMGVAIYHPRGQEHALCPYIKSYHILIEENMHPRSFNCKYAPPYRNSFNGGVSYVLKLHDAAKLTKKLIEEYFHQPMPCMLVGHDVEIDISRLGELGVVIPHHVQVLDTQKIYSQTHGVKGDSFKNALRNVRQPYASLHNAGNDAYYTVLLAMRLCDPLVRRMTKFDSNVTNWGMFINDNLEYNKSKEIHTAVEAILKDEVDNCDLP